MRCFFKYTSLAFSFFIYGCGPSINDDALLKRLDARLPVYNANYINNGNIPRYEYDQSLPVYRSPSQNNTKNSPSNNVLYPTYDSEADNPVVPSIRDVSPMYEYPTYDPEADNPYYSGQTYTGQQNNRGFDDRVYDDYYPTYNQNADNPVYPYYNEQQIYGDYNSPPPQRQYEYYNYEPEADNPVVPSAPSNTLFDSPSFDGPMFDR